jgi:hypothetical protein
VDPEAAARAIAEDAKRARPKTPRWLWAVAVIVAVACVGALAVAWLHAPPAATTSHRELAAPDRSGFASGLIVGIGIGLGAGVVLLRRR